MLSEILYWTIMVGGFSILTASLYYENNKRKLTQNLQNEIIRNYTIYDQYILKCIELKKEDLDNDLQKSISELILSIEQNLLNEFDELKKFNVDHISYIYQGVVDNILMNYIRNSIYSNINKRYSLVNRIVYPII